MIPHSFKVRTSLLKSSFLSAIVFSGMTAGVLMPIASAQKSRSLVITLSDGRVFSGLHDTELSVKEGTTAFVQGKFVAYKVNLDTFAVSDYTLTSSLTYDKPMVIFASREPWSQAKLIGMLSIKLTGEQVVLSRAGTGVSLTLRAKDKPQGYLLNLESAQEIAVRHTLGPDFWYYFDIWGHTRFTNGILVGLEIPQGAKRFSPIDPSVKGATQSFWSIQAGGRLGVVIDAETRKIPTPFKD